MKSGFDKHSLPYFFGFCKGFAKKRLQISRARGIIGGVIAIKERKDAVFTV